MITTLKVYLLDLLSYREVSNAITDIFEVEHQSPQILLIKNGNCVFHQSHNAISTKKFKSVSIEMSEVVQRKPKWLRVKLPTGKNYKHVRKLVSEHKLHTICESGNCPNMGECWGEGTATFYDF